MNFDSGVNSNDADFVDVDATNTPDITFLEVPLSCIICIIYIFIGLAIHSYKEIYHEPPWIHESSVACIIGR